MNGFMSALRKPFLWIVILALAAAAALSCVFVPDYEFENITEYSFISPIEICENGIGDFALIDSRNVVIKTDRSGNIKYAVTPADLPGYGDIHFSEATFDADGKLYVSAYVVSPDAYLTDMDVVLIFDENGAFVREMLRYDYRGEEDRPRESSRIKGLAVDGDNLCYIYMDECNSFQYKISALSDSEITTAAEYSRGDYSALHRADYIGEGEYVLSLTNGESGVLNRDGEYSMLAYTGYSMTDIEDSFIPTSAALYRDEIYVLDFSSYCICRISEEIEYLYDISDFVNDDSDSVILSIFGLNDKLAAVAENGIFIIDGDNKYALPETYTLPLNAVISGVIHKIFPWVSLGLSVIGLVLFFGWLMKWRLSILSKQLLATIPVIIIAFSVVTINVYFNMVDSLGESFASSMTAISELSVKALDGDEIEEMTGSDCVEDGSLFELHKKLSELIGYNKDSWNRNIELSVYTVLDDDILQSLATSMRYELPFLWSLTDAEDDESEQSDEKSRILYVDTMTGTEIDVQTPILNSDGGYVGILRATVYMKTIEDFAEKTIVDMGIKIFISMPFLIAAIAVVSVISAGYLKKTKSVVSKIAEGDFSVRIEKSPKDEIGEICTGVNAMAKQLEEYFDEKDKNERFYYKFVPEKFRELLHKDDFTDLALGDAESADLTVLFCDIRSFSLNSEMMTARENFEFVNIIYGKAGPIIRNHNGFVDKYIGDAVMALFENADDAVEAGIELYREIVLNKATAEQLNVSSINIGIGIHSGMARIGIVGEDERMSGTVISNTVNLSSRLESLTKKYATAMIISKDTLDRMADPDRLNTRYLGMIQVAGVNEVKALYEVLDCLDDERKTERSAGKGDFREAVKLFHLGDLNGSLELFRKLKSESVNDPALDIYISAISEKLENGDFEHNVFRFSRK